MLISLRLKYILGVTIITPSLDLCRFAYVRSPSRKSCLQRRVHGRITSKKFLFQKRKAPGSDPFEYVDPIFFFLAKTFFYHFRRGGHFFFTRYYSCFKFYPYECFACMNTSEQCVCGAGRGQKGAEDPLQLELQMVGRSQEGTENVIWVVWKRCQCS